MKNGFTLSEVLITLTVIGVVAAITLPSFIQKYKNHLLKNQFKLTVSILMNAVKKMEADDVDVAQTLFSLDYNTFYSYFKGNYSNITQANAGYTNYSGKVIHRRSQFHSYENPYTLNTGATLWFDVGSKFGSDLKKLGVSCDSTTCKSMVFIMADINGYKNKPNALGKDLFEFWYNPDTKEFLPVGSYNTKYYSNLFGGSDIYYFGCPSTYVSDTHSEQGRACSADALSNEKYFDNLSW